MLVLAMAGVLVYFARANHVRTVTVTVPADWVEQGDVAFRLDSLTIQDKLPEAFAENPPDWLANWFIDIPVTYRAWRFFHPSYKVAQGAAVWVVLEGRIRVPSDEMLTKELPRFGLVLNGDTIIDDGSSMTFTNGESVSREGAKVGARFYATSDTQLTAVEVQVNGRWLRVPVEPVKVGL